MKRKSRSGANVHIHQILSWSTLSNQIRISLGLETLETMPDRKDETGSAPDCFVHIVTSRLEGFGRNMKIMHSHSATSSFVSVGGGWRVPDGLGGKRLQTPALSRF